jgi:hypothetical protein
MISHENPVFGRKVFFLNPPYNVSQFVLKQLREDEYEIYVIDDYHNVKNILRHFPESICFLNIDDQLTTDQWFNFIVSFEQDPSLKTILPGILASRTRKSEKEHFLLHAAIPAGFIPTNGSMEDLTETIRGILELNGAKGRRQYVRAKCSHDPTAVVHFTSGNRVIPFQLLDISTVGLACAIPPSLGLAFQPNSVIRDVTIILGAKRIQCSTAVYSVKNDETESSLVLLFMKGTPFSVKKTIREYIARAHQYEMRISIQNDQPDETDYSIPPRLQRASEEAFLVNADDTDDIITAPDLSPSVEDISAAAGSKPPAPEGLTITSLY